MFVKYMTGDYIKKSTIKKNLSSYFLKTAALFSSLLLLCVVMLTFNQFYQHREYRNLFILNDFYSNLDQMNTSYVAYTQNGGEEAYRELTQQGQELLEVLEQIDRIPAGAVFRRDVRDIRQVFSNYLEDLEQIRLKKEEQIQVYGTDALAVAKIQKEINVLQSNATSLYDQIGGEFKNLYSQILGASQASSQRWEKIMLVSFLLLLAATAVILVSQIYGAFYWADRISSPLVKLACRIREIMAHGWDADYQEIQTSEIANVETETLVTGFGEMICQLKKSAEAREAYLKTELELRENKVENLRIQKELKSNQIKLLQAQINPHFLFNTLNLVSQTAYLEKAGKTVDMLGKTASLLRYYLDFSDKTVTLRREMEELKNYANLQQARFQERIQFSFFIEKCCEAVLIPSNILQPLLENSIIHGIGGYTRGGKIAVRVEFMEERHSVSIRVTDNGIGMTSEQIEELEGLLRSGKSTGKHIGLSNVSRKLKYYFGDEAEIILSSDPGVETNICLIVPEKAAGK